MNDKYIPKALQHAEWLELSLAIGAQDAADELRRLHEVEVAYGVMMAQAESRIAEPEPVALETVYEIIIQWDEGGGKRSRRELARRIVALYTTPQRRKWVGLTDDEIAVICGECAASAHRTDDISYARAIEAKLKEKNA